ncbi:MAG: hypothetical protein V4546_15295 [Bacteroidota bacterium]
MSEDFVSFKPLTKKDIAAISLEWKLSSGFGGCIIAYGYKPITEK